MDFKDHFSSQAADYARYRPRYPQALFAYLAGLAGRRNRAWDCATGGGQAAQGLAPYFREVIATDASEAQIQHAVPHPNISYRLALAEASELDPDSVDLITVAQAIHWFDFDGFYQEVMRVATSQGVLAFWGYGLPRIEAAIDAALDRLYAGDVGPYWPKERRHIDRHYASVPLPFQEIDVPQFAMTSHWHLDHFLGYVRTWSAVARYIRDTGHDPVCRLAAEMIILWGEPHEIKPVTWPIFLRVARVMSSHGTAELSRHGDP